MQIFCVSPATVCSFVFVARSFKGLVFDFKKGNILKFAEDGEMVKACHGFQVLTEEELKDIYPEGWPYFGELKRSINELLFDLI